MDLGDYVGAVAGVFDLDHGGRAPGADKCTAMAQAMSSPDKWLPVSIAPADMDLEVCVMARDGAHALVFPCRRTDSGWADSATGKRLDIAPTHWRRWQDGG